MRSHTGFWEYLIAIFLRNRGISTFSPEDMEHYMREIEEHCNLEHVESATIYEQLTQRCCAQGSIEFGSLLNYFNKNEDESYSLFNPENHTPIPQRRNIEHFPSERIIKHIEEKHEKELKWIKKFLELEDYEI
jgi:hypothetical protein